LNSERKQRILVVDDEPYLRELLSRVLNQAGYEVCLARNGLEALLELRKGLPDLIISDLRMPRMSGFELLSIVRRRFPDIPVLVLSGVNISTDETPGAVLADAFYAKGQRLADLVQVAAELIRDSAALAMSHRQLPAPVWIPRSGMDHAGKPSVILNCTDCLRSFRCNIMGADVRKIQEAICGSCEARVRFIVDSTVSSVPLADSA
jgi:CheY-like chemotaxis protein